MSGAPDLRATERHDPGFEAFLADVTEGLRASPKTLPCKYFYDERGSRLFDDICELEAYYPTRTELKIMRDAAPEIASALGSAVRLVEYGSGSSIKTRILLDHLRDPAAYVPVDISAEHLTRSAAELSSAYPGLKVLPVCADFTRDFPLPEVPEAKRTVVYFPGSTIGNFSPKDAAEFLRGVADLCGPGGGLLIGVDLVKDRPVLERAYNDEEGVTAAFNLNLLRRLNRELGANFELDGFLHVARWNPEESRIEMHLTSERDQQVQLGEHTFSFAKGETIHTESSYKYRLESFARLAAEAGFDRSEVWTDERDWFSVQLFTVA
ncbi:MAG: L-histidine N(alpha)-methyltransferase [Myxococcales bacterium]|nr:L-histidine N(alpha)-methyltransferase [Myxococcales bacterium]